MGTPGEGGSSPGRTQLFWCPFPLPTFPHPTGCTKLVLITHWGHLALWAWALGTWHSRGAELRAGMVLGAHSAQDLSALPVSLGAIGVTWDNPWASLPEVLKGHCVPRPGDPKPQHGQRPLTAGPRAGAGFTRAPLLWGAPVLCGALSGLCSPALL